MYSTPRLLTKPSVTVIHHAAVVDADTDKERRNASIRA